MSPSSESGSPAAGATRGRSRWLRRLIVFFALLFLILAAVPTLVGTLGRGIVASKISERLQGEAALRDLSLGWLSGTSVEGLVITADGAEAPSISIDSARFDTGLLSLIMNGVKGTLEVSGVTVRAEKEGDRIDLAELVKPSEPPASESSGELPELDLDLRLRDVTLHYRDAADPAAATLESFARIDAKLQTGAPAHVVLEDGRGLNAEIDLHWLDGRRVRSAEAMEATAKLSAEGYSLEGLASAVRPWMSTLGGQLDTALDLRLKGKNVAVTGPLTIAELRARPRHGGEETALRRAAFRCDVGMNEQGDPNGTLRGEVEGLRLAALTATGRPLSVDSGRVVVEFLPKRTVSCSELDVAGEGLRATGLGRFALGGEVITGNSRLQIEGDLKHLAAFAGDLPEMSGALTSRVELDLGPAGEIKVEGETRVRDFAATGLPGGAPDIREPEVLLQHDLTWGDGRIDARHARLRASFAKASVTGSLTPGREGRKAAGRLEVSGQADLLRLAGLLGDRLPVGLRGQAKLSGTVAAAADGFQVDATLDGTGLVVSGGPLEGEPLTLDRVRVRTKGRLSAEADTLDLPEFSVESPVLQGRGALRWSAPAEGEVQAGVKGQFTLAVETLLRSLQAESSRSLDLGRPELSLDVQRQGDAYDIKSLALRQPELQAKASGRVVLPAEGTRSGGLSFELDGDLARLTALAGDTLPVQVAGRMKSSGRVELGEAMRLVIDAQAADFALRGDPLGSEALRSDAVLVRAEGAWNSGQAALDLRNFLMRSEQLEVRLEKPTRLEGLGTDAGVNGNLEVRGTARLAKLPAGLLSLPEGLQAKGDAAFGGKISLAASQPRGTLDLSCPELGLERLGEIAMSCQLRTLLRLDPEGPFALDLDAERLVVQQAGQAPAAPTTLSLDATGKLPRDGGPLSIPDLKLRAPGLDANGSITWGGGQASLVKLGADCDLSRLSDSLLPVFASGIRGAGAGRIDVDVQAPAGDGPPLKKAVGSITAQMKRLESETFALDDVDVVMEMDNGLARMSRGKARMNGGAVAIVGTVNFRGDVPQWSTRIVASKVRIEERLQPAIARVVPLFAGLGVRVEAQASGDLQLGGSGSAWEIIRETLNGDGALTIEKGALVGGPLIAGLGQFVGLPGRVEFDTFVPRFQIKDGGVHQEGVVIKGNKIDFSLSGLTKLDGALDYVLGVRVKSGGTARWQQVAQVLGKDGFLPIGLGGSVSSPSIKPPDPSQLAGGALKGLLDKQLKDKLPGGIGELLNPKGGGKDGKKPGGGLPGGLEGLLRGNQKTPEAGGKKPKDDGKKPPRPPSLLDLLRGKDKKKDKDKKDKKPSGGGG